MTGESTKVFQLGLASARFYKKRRDELEDLTLIVEDLEAENEELGGEVVRLKNIDVEKDRTSAGMRQTVESFQDELKRVKEEMEVLKSENADLKMRLAQD